MLQLEIPLATVRHAVALCRKLGVPSILDPRRCRRAGCRRRCTRSTCSRPTSTRRHSSRAVGASRRTRCSATLLARGPEQVVLKLGPRGAIARGAGRLDRERPRVQGESGRHHRRRRRVHRRARGRPRRRPAVGRRPAVRQRGGRAVLHASSAHSPRCRPAAPSSDCYGCVDGAVCGPGSMRRTSRINSSRKCHPAHPKPAKRTSTTIARTIRRAHTRLRTRRT